LRVGLGDSAVDREVKVDHLRDILEEMIHLDGFSSMSRWKNILENPELIWGGFRVCFRVWFFWGGFLLCFRVWFFKGLKHPSRHGRHDGRRALQWVVCLCSSAVLVPTVCNALAACGYRG
jgi:hypothetical protein